MTSPSDASLNIDPEVALRCLNAVLANSKNKAKSVCVRLGCDDDRPQDDVVINIGPDRAWAQICRQYAAKKCAYLRANPRARTSFEGVSTQEGVFGGGARLEGYLIAPSGIESEGDLVTGLYYLVCMGLATHVGARERAAGVSEECLALFDLVHADLSDLLDV